MFKWFNLFGGGQIELPREEPLWAQKQRSLGDNGGGGGSCYCVENEVFSFSGNKSKKELETYINSKPDCKFISCARAKNSSGFVLKFSCKLSTISATLPEECHIFIDKYNLSITELVK